MTTWILIKKNNQMKRLLNKSHSSFNLDAGILIFRVTISLLMLSHGIPKLMKFFAGEPVSFASVFGLGTIASLSLIVFAEVVCSILLLFGLATRLALIPLITAMSIVVLHIHAEDPLVVKEKALLFLLSFVILFFTGSGKYSLDNMIHGKGKNFRTQFKKVYN